MARSMCPWCARFNPGWPACRWCKQPVKYETNGRLVRDEPSPPDPWDDWEGPPTPEYREYDAEAYDEMIRHDLEGRS